MENASLLMPATKDKPALQANIRKTKRFDQQNGRNLSSLAIHLRRSTIIFRYHDMIVAVMALHPTPNSNDKPAAASA